MKRRPIGILAVLILFAWISPAVTQQVEPPYDPAILPQEYAGPPLPISIPDAIANSGAARLSYPISVPPGRRGMAPRLALEYNSSGRNGITGVGWNLSLGAIQRSTRNGLDYKSAAFEHDGEELVARPDWGPGFYGTKREERFSKYQVVSASSGWIMTTRDGVRYFFGSQAGSRQENQFGVFQWCLDRVEDPNGNYYLITYSKDQGQIYPAQIAYTGNGRLSPTHSIHFTYGSRPDAVESYLTKTRVVTAKLLTAITTKANGQPARSHTLVYETGRSGRSRLKQVKADPLPPATFTYEEGSNGAFVRRISTATEGENDSGFVFNGHCDFDGYPDLIKFSRNSPAPYVYVYLSDGAGGYGEKIITRLAGGANAAGFLLVADFDADGPVDIVKVEPTSTRGTVYFHKGLGNGSFAPAVRADLGGIIDPGRILVGDVVGRDGRLELIKLKSLSGQVRVHRLDNHGRFDLGEVTNLTAAIDTGRLLVMDCNGDRQDDLVRTDLTSHIFVHLSVGDGTFTGRIETDLGNGPNEKGRLLTGDFNGDGLPDLLKLESLSSRAHVHFSLGNGTFTNGFETYLGGGPIEAGRILIADIDQDGIPDIVRHYNNTAAVDCYRSIGNGTFRPPVRTALAGSAPLKGYVAAANIDGAGGADLVQRDHFGKFTTFFSAPSAPDVLIKAANGLGAVYSFGYASSAEYENLYLPFNLETLATVTVEDGNGVTAKREYGYAGGLYDPVDAEFRGFNRVDETLPDRTTQETTFHQDEYLRGKEQQISRRDPADRLLTKTTLTWEAEPQQGVARFLQLKARQVEQFYEPAVFCRDDYAYSATHGCVVSCSRSGTGAEKLTTTTAYRNCGFWNWRPDRETLMGENGGIVRNTFYDYDGKGNKTAEEKWNDRGDNPVTRWTFDGYGNPETRTDARGYTTRYEYEAATLSFPSKIILPQTGAVSHVWKAPAYDYRVGRAATLEDENGNRTFYTYDSLGRLLQADYPDGGRKTYVYVDGSFPNHVKTSVQNGPAAAITSYHHFDGLGRKIEALTYGEKGRRIHTRWLYDSMGRNWRTEGPYFSQNGGYPWEETEYDFWSRPVRVKRPDGEHQIITTTHAYSGLAETASDPDGASKTTVKDFLERVTRVVEHSGQGDIVTEFDYNAAGDLLKITNHAEVATRFDRDSLGRVRGMSDPDMGSWDYTYDANGNLKTQTDGKRQTVVLEYDALNRLILRSYSTADSPVTYTYDSPSVPNGIGRPHTLGNPHATISYDEYDEMGRPISVSRLFAGNPTRYTTRNEYDAAGNLTAITYPLDGYRVAYSYHPGTRLIHLVTGPAGVEFGEFEDYTADGKPGFLYQGNGTSTTFSHDAKSARLTAIRIQSPSLDPADDLFHRTYRYTPGGDISEITDHLQSVTRFYSYDKLHRLVSEKSSNATLVHPSKIVRLKYDYEGAGPFHAPKRIETRGRIHDLSYDPNGNLVAGPALADPQRVHRRAVSYTADNMPARIDQPGARCVEGLPGAACPERVDFAYDGENKRIRKSSAAGNTYYIGKHFEVSNGIPTHYVFAGDLRLAKVTPSGIQHFHKDHLLSTIAVTDESGNKIGSAGYIPFGQGRNSSGERITRFKYTDQELDPETGFYNLKARLYDPAMANFITPDPYLSANMVFRVLQDSSMAQGTERGAGRSAKLNAPKGTGTTQAYISYFSKSPQRLNRYSYAVNNPANFFDPNGQWPTWIHNKIIGQAFLDLPKNLINAMEQGSEFADSFKFQNPKFSFMHAMRQKDELGRDESVEAASSKMKNYINEHINNYTTLKEAGQLERAYFELGMALHPIMDSTSPSHMGFQVWEGVLNTPGYKLAIHWWKEQIISPEQLSRTVELIKQAINE